MLKFLVGVTMASCLLAAPAAAVTLVRFEVQGTLPALGANILGGPDVYTDAQKTLLNSFQQGATFAFTVEYDRDAAPSPTGLFAATFIGGRVGALTDFSGFGASLRISPQQPGQITDILNVNVTRNLPGAPGERPFLSSVNIGLFDFGGDLIVGGVLPTAAAFAAIDSLAIRSEISRPAPPPGVTDRRNVNFNNVPFSVTAVPEPSTWLLLIGGFAATGAALRRRRTALKA